jgi:hypothetical protein
MAKPVMRRDTGRGKVMWFPMNYWLTILQMEKEDLGKECWAKKLKDEVDKIRLTCVCHGQQENAIKQGT